MNPFDYERPTDLAVAATLLAEPDTALLAGGTNLVDLMKLGVATPATVVDVRGLGLGGVEADGDTLVVGASLTNSELAADPQVRERYPVLAQALLAGASGQLRNVATTAGNLLQRTRCPYFMDASKPCNKREPGSGCPAREGFHRMHAVFGASDSCIATNPSDMSVAMAALDGVVVVFGPGGERRIPMADFHRLPGDEPQRDTTLDRDEIVLRVELPPLPAGTRSAYRKVRDRASYAFAVVSVAATVTIVNGTVADLRLAFGGVAHKPWRAEVAEAALRGSAVDELDGALGSALDAELAQARPLPQNAFKLPLLRSVASATVRDLVRESGDAR